MNAQPFVHTKTGDFDEIMDALTDRVNELIRAGWKATLNTGTAGTNNPTIGTLSIEWDLERTDHGPDFEVPIVWTSDEDDDS